MRAAAVKVLTKDRSDVSSVHREEEEMITHTHQSAEINRLCVFKYVLLYSQKKGAAYMK